MPGIAYVLDPDGAPLALSEANGINVLKPVRSVPAKSEKLWTSNIDSEGELSAGSKRGNSEHTLPLRLTGATEKEFRERQVKLEQKFDKLDREGGVLRVILPDEEWIDWEVRAVDAGEKLFDNRYVHHKRTQGEITFTCAPFGKGEEELIGEFSFAGAAKRVLEVVAEKVKGSAMALGRAVVTSPEADMWHLMWGKESRSYSEAATAKDSYAAKELTPLGGATSTTATVDGQAGTSVVRQATLTPNWTAMLSTQISGVGQMTHEGVFEPIIWVHMPATNTGEVGIGFEYWVGDSVRRVELEPIYFEPDHYREGKVIQLPLGHIFLRASENGSHQWEGRVIARSTVTGDDLDILDIALRPLEEGNGKVAITPTLQQPAALVTRDEFDQGVGALNGKVLAAAQSLATKSPGTGADDAAIGTVAWSNPGNVTAADGVKATAASTPAATSHYLKATNFGFAIPEGAKIDGIVIEVKRSAVGVAGDSAARIIKGGVIQAAGRAADGNWPASSTYQTYGSPTDLWGATWTAADINKADFGFAIAANITAATAEIDHIQATIYYTDAASQTWATSGDAVDISVETAGHTAQRSEVSDANINTGRYAVAGTTVFTDVVSGVQFKRGALTAGASERIRGGALARYVNESNWLFFGADVEAPSAPVTDRVRIIKRKAGTVTELAKVTIPDSAEYRRVWLHVDRRGRYFCWGSLLTSGLPRLLIAGQDNDLATGGALDDGKNGFNDAKTGALANTRNYDNFVAWIPPLDAVIFSGLSLELRHDGVEREAQGGGTWTPLIPEGDYLKLEPADMENRKNRLVFIASPNDPETMGVGFPKKLTVALYATPRYRTIPDPA